MSKNKKLKEEKIIEQEAEVMAEVQELTPETEVEAEAVEAEVEMQVTAEAEVEEEILPEPETEVEIVEAAPVEVVCSCEDCHLSEGQFIREVNGVKYLAQTDKHGVSTDIRKL